jgi:hypothetical protein
VIFEGSELITAGGVAAGGTMMKGRLAVIGVPKVLPPLIEISYLETLEPYPRTTIFSGPTIAPALPP